MRSHSAYRMRSGAHVPLAERRPGAAYTVLLTHAERGVLSFKLTASATREVQIETTRRMRALGGGWTAVICEGARVVATRAPGGGRWKLHVASLGTAPRGPSLQRRDERGVGPGDAEPPRQDARSVERRVEPHVT